jgi:hypothetical protein
MRELWTLESRRGFPGTLVRVGDSAGALLFLELSTAPVVQVAALAEDDVRELVASLDAWLRERESAPSPAPGPVPLVGGAIARGRDDALRSVQSCTVPGSSAQEIFRRAGVAGGLLEPGPAGNLPADAV